MFRHVLLYLSAADPVEYGLQIILLNRRSCEIFIAHEVRAAVGFGEIAFGVAQPRRSIHGIQQFLVCQFLSGYIDGLEPFQFLFVRTGTTVDIEFVVEDLLFFLFGEIVKITEQVRKVAVHILTNRNGTLLPVNNLKSAIIVH